MCNEQRDTLDDTQPMPPFDDDDDDEPEDYLACPKCGEDENFHYVGEADDEDCCNGDEYHCEECGYNFVICD